MEQVHGVTHGNDFTWNVIIFVVDNISSIDIDNRKNRFLVLGERSADDINDSVGKAEEKNSINFTKANTKRSLSLHWNGNESCLHVNKTDISKI